MGAAQKRGARASAEEEGAEPARRAKRGGVRIWPEKVGRRGRFISAAQSKQAWSVPAERGQKRQPTAEPGTKLAAAGSNWFKSFAV